MLSDATFDTDSIQTFHGPHLEGVGADDALAEVAGDGVEEAAARRSAVAVVVVVHDVVVPGIVYDASFFALEA